MEATGGGLQQRSQNWPLWCSTWGQDTSTTISRPQQAPLIAKASHFAMSLAWEHQGTKRKDYRDARRTPARQILNLLKVRFDQYKDAFLLFSCWPKSLRQPREMWEFVEVSLYRSLAHYMGGTGGLGKCFDGRRYFGAEHKQEFKQLVGDGAFFNSQASGRW